MTPQSLVDALVAGKRRDAERVVLDALDEGMDPLDLYCDLVQPAMYEVGRLWEQNTITVAREHAATAIAEYVLGRVFARLPQAETARGRAVVVGPTGERHQIGPRIVADALEADGWDVRYLGIDVPDEATVASVLEHQAILVCISATLATTIPMVRDLIGKIRLVTADGARILVGGRAFVVGGMWRAVGADGYGADARGAVEAARAVLV